MFINKTGKNILIENAGQHIGGYFLAIDITDRGKYLNLNNKNV